MRLRWVSEEDVSPARALAAGAMLAEATAESDAPVVLYGATLSGDPVAVLGRWQPELALNEPALSDKGVAALRRETGGPACLAGAGVVYVALCLRNASTLIACPPDRVLNRNVRGVLGGLSKGGVPSHYFGREWVSIDRRPAGLVGWDRLESGAVVLEFFLAVTRSFALPDELSGYPAQDEPRFLGKDPVTLKEAWEQVPSGGELIRMIAEGHADRFDEVELERSSLTDAERTEASRLADGRRVTLGGAPQRWVKPLAVPVGYVTARMERDEEGLVQDVEVAGDFFQDRGAPALLRKKLVGSAPDSKTLSSAVASTWDGSRYVIEGLKELDPLVSVLAQAAGK